MGGAIKVKRDLYILSRDIELRGDDVTLYGEGHGSVHFIEVPLLLCDDIK